MSRKSPRLEACRKIHASRASRACGCAGAGFTLIELMVVVSIIGLMVALLLPALSTAQEAGRAARCGSNQRQIGTAAGLYGADHNNWMASPMYLQWFESVGGTVGPGNGLTMPASYSRLFTSFYYSHPDIYQALDYVVYARLNYAGRRGSDVFVCPTAVARLSPITPTTGASTNFSNSESHYFFTDLLVDYARPSTGTYNLYRRSNSYGPYKGDEILQPSLTFFAGDAYMIRSATGVTPQKRYGWELVADGAGNGPPAFGTVVNSGYSYSHGADVSSYHTGGAQGLYFDGHVNLVRVPRATLSSRWTLGRAFTARYDGRSTFLTTVGPKIGSY